MSHDYHAKNRLLDEVVGDFNDHKDEILMDNDDNNINDNDDNDIQFLFQPTTTENVYRPYPNCTDVGDNQVVENPNYFIQQPIFSMIVVWHFVALRLSNMDFSS